jgi:putative tricarboxylic transport membrane protein
MLVTMSNVITKSAGIETRYVPFAGAGPNLVALLGGHIDFRICMPAEAITMIRAGKTRGLAISSEKRLEALPDVPTFTELGIGPAQRSYREIWGPPNMPPKIVDFISKAVEKASKDPEYVKIQEKLLYTVDYRPAQRMIETAKNFNEVWGPFLKESYK